jgi:hypothetical protein
MQRDSFPAPTGFVEDAQAGERPTFADPATGDQVFIWPFPRFAATARLGGKVLVIETDDYAAILNFLTAIAEWRASNADFFKRIADAGGCLTDDTPNDTNDNF